jgi:two-component system chemotaxis response regulator CheY
MMEATSRTALLVEDAPLFRRILGDYLRRLGFTDIREAPSGNAALAALEQYRPDLVCLDLVLPDVSGYDLCEFIRGTERLADVPVLMVSARHSPADRAHAEEAGATGFLPKPFSQEDFELHVNQVLARADGARAAAGRGR